MSSDDAAIAPASGEKPSCAARCSSKWAQFKRFMYKPETGQVMDRLPFEWLQLIAYFLVFYACLGAFFYGNLRAFMLTMHPQKPSLTGTDNLLRLKPGLGYRPQPRVEDNLIRYTMGVVNSSFDPNDKEKETEFGYQKYVDALDKFFAPYRDNNTDFLTNKTAGNLTECNATVHADYTRSCIFNLTSLGECAPTWLKPGSTYGYAKGEPCVLIKLNKVYGWLPAINDTVTIEKWSDLSVLGNNSVIERYGPFVNCSGEHAADKDVMSHRMPHIKYYPSQFFSPLFYPYLNQKLYLAPVVMVQLKGIPKNSVLQVECRLWGTGIDYYDKLDRMASVHFEVLVDELPAAAAAPAAAPTAAPIAAPATIKV